ncbi:hypothetical protein BIW11_04960 [Tropilaelaps mercedesae]|uniref:Uncharacterized protein n=1 Tax=Tropilaelaps mercedesae TaxID=418985 RepID=A0A1V9WZA5_9ACAR|nr:hypothetical protein BIW11_04960 [Tropilaelaps mercedesae]
MDRRKTGGQIDGPTGGQIDG